MPAYYRAELSEFTAAEPQAVMGQLQIKYAQDGFAQQYLTQTRAWADVIPLLQAESQTLIGLVPGARFWTILLEFPLYRLQRRIDIVILTTSIVVIESKFGEERFVSSDERQVEEYCLDLRDFHEGSRGQTLIPVLWATHAPSQEFQNAPVTDFVASVSRVGATGLAGLIAANSNPPKPTINAGGWDTSGYHPVPSVIQAATSIFAGHDVRQMAQADASNLGEAATHVVDLIAWGKRTEKKALIFLTGVPGSGKTLAGLQAVHDAIATGEEQQGDVVYLSGNTPLVTVLREALARSEYSRLTQAKQAKSLHDIRRLVRTRIQHVNDFLKQVLHGGGVQVPFEHAIVFDEAQRAWDERQGLKKFSRTASEPDLLLQVMGLRGDWCACVCLVGGGQEINSGERGVSGWGDAIRGLAAEDLKSG
jgi:Schlafen group 3, DNA/RNA helicase domain